MSSVFTKIINGDIPSYKVFEDEKHYAFLDINPLSKGHTLVVPKREVDYIFDLEDAEYQQLHLFAKKVATALKKATDCNRVGVAVIGLEVPHAHIHLIPIESESDMDFRKARVKLSSEEFKEIASKIASEI